MGFLLLLVITCTFFTYFFIIKIKKSLIILFALTCLSHAQTDFLDAAEAYENKDYVAAFEEFSALARLGNKRAQFNLGVMYLNGEGVEKDVSLAYAWGKLSEHDARPEFAQISERILKQVPTDSHHSLILAAEKIHSKFGDEAINQQLFPVTLNDSESPHQIDLQIVHREAPMFPLKALKEGKQGWVTVVMDIYPDGSVRNASIIEAFPDDSFNEVSIDVVKNFRFALHSDQPITHPIQAHQTIEFEIPTKASKKGALKEKYKHHLDQLQTLAEQNHPQAQYLYAMAGNASLLRSEDRLNDAGVNEWLLQSAQNGYKDAQFILGKNILYGKGCQANNEKGLKWLIIAAEFGHDKASRELYQLMKNNKAQSELPAHHWLKLSADAGNPESQLDYSEFLLSQESPGQTAIDQAKTLLKAYKKVRKEGVKWYQQMSRLSTLVGNEKAALKYQKKANKMAKKLGWDMSLASQ